MGNGPRISIVEDDPSVARAVSRLCRSAGYAVEAFESAEEFLDTGGSENTECLILDVHLPGLSGIQLQARLVENRKRVPIVFITAFESARTKDVALELGARAFLRKPLDSEKLLAVIQNVLEENAI